MSNLLSLVMQRLLAGARNSLERARPVSWPSVVREVIELDCSSSSLLCDSRVGDGSFQYANRLR